MLNKTSTKEILEAYSKLPKKITDLFWSEDISTRLQKIEKTFDLTEHQGDILTEIIAHVFLGLLPPCSMRESLQKELSVDNLIANKITEEAFRSLIFPFQEELKEVYTDEDFKIFKNETLAEKIERERKGGVSDSYREPIE